MWKIDEHAEIRGLFEETFGTGSEWGRRALKSPLVLGISGSRTYDFVWRVENGEFATSRMLEREGGGKGGGDVGTTGGKDENEGRNLQLGLNEGGDEEGGRGDGGRERVEG